MARGDEPALGGQSDDNSPMISSTATRAITNPLDGGLYHRNLRSFVFRMNETTQATFNRAVIRQAVTHTSQISTLLASRPGYIEILNAAGDWVDNPTDEKVNRVRDLSLNYHLFRWPEGVTATSWMRIRSDVQPEILECIMLRTVNSVGSTRWPDVLPAKNCIEAVRFVAAVLHSGIYAPINRKVALARTWQLEAARAILDDAPIPPLEVTP
jgi:hypothetical protein